MLISKITTTNETYRITKNILCLNPNIQRFNLHVSNHYHPTKYHMIKTLQQANQIMFDRIDRLAKEF